MVWEKRILTKKYVAGLVKYLNKNDKDNITKYNEAKYEKIQDGLNCNNRLIVNYRCATYTNDNDIIDMSENDNAKWSVVIPESIADKLLDVVCGYCDSNKILEQK